MKSLFRMIGVMHVALLMTGSALVSCSSITGIATSAQRNVLEDSALKGAHVGICVYDPAKGTYLYQHDGDRYFVPASNTKLFSCYAGLRYLGDSLPGLQYAIQSDTLFIRGTGDPTLLHPDFKTAPVWDFLKGSKLPIVVNDRNWRSAKLGRGWAWDDNLSYYAAERSPIPVFGNVLKATFKRYSDTKAADTIPYYKLSTVPPIIGDGDVTYQMSNAVRRVNIDRAWDDNHFTVAFPDKDVNHQEDISFATKGTGVFMQLLSKENKRVIADAANAERSWQTNRSQPTDTMLTMMMHNSDNFFAEQTLMMVSNSRMGYMSDSKIIDTLLKTDLKDLPQRPMWVDGSGLSRYNLFTPQDMVFILEKMRNEFGMDRLKTILATGGTGTLGSLYKNISGQIFAKTGTLSNHVALSGFLYTKKGNLLVFSIMVNGHMNTASNVRKAMERFVMELWEKR